MCILLGPTCAEDGRTSPPWVSSNEVGLSVSFGVPWVQDRAQQTRFERVKVTRFVSASRRCGQIRRYAVFAQWPKSFYCVWKFVKNQVKPFSGISATSVHFSWFIINGSVTKGQEGNYYPEMKGSCYFTRSFQTTRCLRCITSF